MMPSPGPLLASGRDADIFEFGPNCVLKRSREGHDLSTEARAMEFARGHGVRVPEVVEVRANGLEVVMERINGIDMVAALTRKPWSAKKQGGLLSDLHHQIHELTAPSWLKDAPVSSGDRLLHLDLHPLNVMLTRSGPYVIDWANAAKGDPNFDVALAWILLSAGEARINKVIEPFARLIRSSLTNSFLEESDSDALKALGPQVVAWKARDPHMAEGELRGMWRVVGGKPLE
jgi:tRNA A-37 threonylcarbamoyl transferase component Bud32